jgi:3-hydroxyacyl-[acyl-carrier-protein] dehydratase
MPGVLMIEAMAQLGGIICLSPPMNDPTLGQRLFFFTGVNGVRWKRPVVPGDQLIMEMNLVGFDERLGFATMTGKAYVGGMVSELGIYALRALHCIAGSFPHSCTPC